MQTDLSAMPWGSGDVPYRNPRQWSASAPVPPMLQGDAAVFGGPIGRASASFCPGSRRAATPLVS